MRKAFAKYLECGIFAHGFARARCGDCGHDYFVAFSCKGRESAPRAPPGAWWNSSAPERSRIPRLPVRQWVLSVPKRLRYFMQRDGAVLSMVLRIFLRVIAQTLQTHSPGAAHMDKAGLHIGAIAFIHRFGSSLNETSTSTFVVDGVFEEVEGEGDADATPRISSRVSSFTRPPASMRLPWPQCRPHCKNVSCAPLWAVGRWRTSRQKRCWGTNTAVSRWMPGVH